MRRRRKMKERRRKDELDEPVTRRDEPTNPRMSARPFGFRFGLSDWAGNSWRM
jgi:hypothetical protein